MSAVSQRNRAQVLRWAVAIGITLLLVWRWQWYQGADVKAGHGFAEQRYAGDYIEDGIELPTYSSPFTCDLDELPAQTRMIRRLKDGYVVLGHGFSDMISDKFWEGEGAYGWEEPLAHQMGLYMKAISYLENNRDGFMDLGANIGTHTLYMAARGYNVHTFEPTPANHALMRCSLAFSGIISPVRLNAFGLGDKALSVCMASAADNYGDSRAIKEDQLAKECIADQNAHIGTLNHYYRKFARGQKIAVFKIDVQGYEIATLQHATSLFDSADAPAAVFFEYDPQMLKDQGYNPLDLGRYFWTRGYSIWRDSKLQSINETEMAVFGTEPWWTGGIDLFAVKDTWKEKLKAAGYEFKGGQILPRAGVDEPLPPSSPFRDNGHCVGAKCT